MSATLWVAWRHFRIRWASLLPFVLVVIVGTAGALTAMNAAYQTDTAFSRYLISSEVGDLLINPSIQTLQIDHTIRGLPGVTHVVTADLFYAAIGEHSSTDEETPIGAVYGSTDGRYVSRDRLAYQLGRAPSGTNEAVISQELAVSENLKIGDPIPLTFDSVQDDIRSIYLGEPPSNGVVGVEYPTVVGIATFPDEVLPDGLFERGRIVVSSDIAERYSCTPDEVAQNATIDELVEQLAPAKCSTSYRYWSLEVPGGHVARQQTLDALSSRIAERNAGLAPVMQDLGLSYIPIVTTTADQLSSVDRTMGPTVVALAAIAITLALVTIAVACLVLTRALRRDNKVHARWNELGLSVRQRATIVGMPAVVAGVLAVLAAFIVAWSIPTGPIGAVEVLETALPALEGWALWLSAVMLATTGTCVLAIALKVAITARGYDRRASSRSNRRSADWVRRPDVAIGVTEAIYRRRSSMLTWVSSVIGYAALAAALVFSTSLSHLVGSPATYGWPWDLANLSGAGYGGVTIDTVRNSLDDEPGIAAWTALGLVQGINVDGVAMPAVIAYESPANSDVVVTSGRLPNATDEIALGSRSASDRSLAIGDEVSIDGDGLRGTRATVTGIVVLPSIGPMQADRATPGRGVLLPDEAFDPDFVLTLVSFVGIDVADGVPVDAVKAQLDDDFQSWELYDRPFTFSEPVRPPEIVNAGSIRSVPFLFAGLVAVAIAIGFFAAMQFSAHSRRRELAVLRTLGFTNGQIRRSLRVQSVLTAVLTCGVGILGGFVFGRSAWRLFAYEIGVVPEPQVTTAVIVAVVFGAGILGVAASVLPGSLATRMRTADELRAH